MLRKYLLQGEICASYPSLERESLQEELIVCHEYCHRVQVLREKAKRKESLHQIQNLSQGFRGQWEDHR